MPSRIMFVQQKTGFDLDSGPCWIGFVEFNRSWKTAKTHGLTLRRWQGFDANFFEVGTDNWFWISGPKRDQTDARYKNTRPDVDEDALDAYLAFLAGAPLPGRENG